MSLEDKFIKVKSDVLYSLANNAGFSVREKGVDYCMLSSEDPYITYLFCPYLFLDNITVINYKRHYRCGYKRGDKSE